MIWATTLVVATWPVMLRVQHRLWHRRSLAVAIMTIALLLVFVVPFSLAITTMVAHLRPHHLVGDGAHVVQTAAAPALAQRPSPVWRPGGAFWDSLADSGVADLVAKAAPYAGGVAAGSSARSVVSALSLFSSC